ncbi:hypothetical protein [Enterobacter hormaechei]|uniref:hypothetical protein n=2 Tax=Enterobacter hormaechei TaxID=158836 RepID=UPI00206AECA1|nr:MAG TPA_asm: hypothetical protein [Caudoviricetes sp.]
MKVINSHLQFSIAYNWKHTPPANKPIPISERGECASILCACLFTTSGSVVFWLLSHSQKENFMRGVVVHHEHRIGYIVIRDQIGEFTVAELLGGYDVEKGHVISGELHSLGGETFTNETEEEEIEVFVQGYGMSEQQSILMIRGIR